MKKSKVPFDLKNQSFLDVVLPLLRYFIKIYIVIFSGNHYREGQLFGRKLKEIIEKSI